jgi:hypothetical protein
VCALHIVVGQLLGLDRQRRRAVGVRDRLGQVVACLSRAACSWRTASASRCAPPADAAAPGVDEVGHPAHPRLRGRQRLLEGPPQPLLGPPLLGHHGQQSVQFGIGLGQRG